MSCRPHPCEPLTTEKDWESIVLNRLCFKVLRCTFSYYRIALFSAKCPPKEASPKYLSNYFQQIIIRGLRADSHS